MKRIKLTEEFKTTGNNTLTTFNFQLTGFEISKLREFFNPRQNQVQTFFTSNTLRCAYLLVALGYKPTDESTEDFVYFEIPEKFRSTTVTKNITERISW